MKKSVISICLALSVVYTTDAFPSVLSRYVTQKVIAAQSQADQGQYANAIESLLHVDSHYGYDQAYINRMLGIYYWRVNDLDKAIDHLSLAVQAKQLKGENAWSTEKMLAGLLLNQHKYKKSLVHFYNLVKQKELKDQDELWLRIAQIHYQLTEWRSVLAAIMRYESLAAEDVIQPLSIKLGAQLQLQQFYSAIATVKRLIPLDKKNRNWWIELVGLLLKTDQKQEALSCLELAYQSQVPLAQQDIILLAQLYAQNQTPERAARVLSQLKGIEKNVTLVVLLACDWQRAGEWEKSEESWLAAAMLDKKYFWNVAQIQIQKREFSDAYTSLQKLDGHYPEQQLAIAKIQVMYKLHKFNSALKIAKDIDNKYQSKEIKGWIKYLNLKTINELPSDS